MRVGGAYVALLLAVLCVHASSTSPELNEAMPPSAASAAERQVVTRRLFGGMLGALLGKPGDKHANTLLGALGLRSSTSSGSSADDDDFSTNLFAEEHVIRENDAQAQKWAALQKASAQLSSQSKLPGKLQTTQPQQRLRSSSRPRSQSQPKRKSQPEKKPQLRKKPQQWKPLRPWVSSELPPNMQRSTTTTTTTTAPKIVVRKCSHMQCRVDKAGHILVNHQARFEQHGDKHWCRRVKAKAEGKGHVCTCTCQHVQKAVGKTM